MVTAPATRRVARGSGHSYYLDGVKALGVTTALGEGFPKPALIGWAANTTAGYAVDHWEELAELGIAERLRTLEKARYADRDEAGNAGTAVHNLALQLALGEEPEIPEYLEGHVDSYLRFIVEWSVLERLVEVVVVNRRYGYMGTLDLVAEIQGDRWLLDFKTARSGVFPENALQLAAYRYAETYIGADGLEHELPAVDRCGVVHIRSDGYDLVPVEAGPDEWRIFLYALQIAKWREDPAVVGEALTPPAREEE